MYYSILRGYLCPAMSGWNTYKKHFCYYRKTAIEFFMFIVLFLDCPLKTRKNIFV